MLRPKSVSGTAADAPRPSGELRSGTVVIALGITQIFAWGSSYYLPAVLAASISSGTGWPLSWVIGGLSLGLIIAGIVSPTVGSTIQVHGGRPVLAISSILLATGLAGIGLAQNLGTYLTAWIVVGLGMGAGLYDAAFATLGGIYQEKARSFITLLTLFGGFASAICWPLSGFLLESVGWRATCLVYAGLQLFLSLPMYLLLLPRIARFTEDTTKFAGGEPAARPIERPSAKQRAVLFALVAAGITLAAIIQSTMSIHLLTILQSWGISLTGAVALGTLVGPSQVFARMLEMVIGNRFHAVWTMVTSTLLVAGALALLLCHQHFIAVGLVFYGAGMGIMSIARGTVPLALFGTSRYAVLMGRLALPSLLAQAIAPLAGAILLEHSGATQTLFVLAVTAILNVMVVGALTFYSRILGVTDPVH